MTVIAIVPALDESLTIAQVVADAQDHVDQVVVIDDGSKDQTAPKAAQAGASVISHTRNMGIGAALMRGYLFAMREKAEIVVQLDADGQHDPGYIPSLISKVENGFDIVVASRYLASMREGIAPWRDLGIRTYSRLVSLISKVKVTDITSGYRAIAAESLREARALPSRHWAIYQTYDYLDSGRAYGEIPARMAPRTQGESQFSTGRSLLYHAEVARSLLSLLIDESLQWPEDDVLATGPAQEEMGDEDSLRSELPSD